MRYTKEEVISALEEIRMIPVFYNPDIEVSKAIVEAAYKAGAKIIEFTNRGENAYEVFVELVKLSKGMPGLILGIGTLMDGPTTQKFIDAGADFIVSPVLIEEMAEVCNKNGVPWMPGCLTLTELVKAQKLGADIIKLFPGSVVGPNYLKAILPVVPSLKLMITGGVEPNEESLSSWFNAGAVCVGMGSQMIDKEMVKNQQWDLLKERIQTCLRVLDHIK
ncbi:MAG: bifunctional 4-hydroxy-2-oxoglutarate aldolase/2-dehydro-3-deoxy-phosphogluconate aldolase [Cyclobacteriaceae bacterium]|nr:bifunctional 4-hydroxy-2-oxoglutarate aldolase/2-dehydro-3-deoxy-phosphogluconate aldolase [Cyclobacteriaceae bacterium]